MTAAIAVSTPTAVGYAIAVWLLIITPGVVTALKGQWWVFAIGFLFAGLIWIVGAFRLARPDSFWARRFYDEEKQRRAEQRFGGSVGT